MITEYMKQRQANIFAGRPLPEKKIHTIAPVSEKRKAKLKEQDVKDSKVTLNSWFDTIQERHFKGGVCPCMECGAMIPVTYSRHATAHLLPKKLFKSVATHELNYLILGAGCGCHAKTDRVDLFVKMKVWPEAKRRIIEMMPLLPFDELKHISSQLSKAIEQ